MRVFAAIVFAVAALLIAAGAFNLYYQLHSLGDDWAVEAAAKSAAEKATGLACEFADLRTTDDEGRWARFLVNDGHDVVSIGLVKAHDGHWIAERVLFRGETVMQRQSE